MPTPYQMALLLARLFAALNLATGPFLIIGSFVVAAVGEGTGLALEGIPFTLLSYGIFYLVAGLAILLFDQKIAAFAAKSRSDPAVPR